MVIINQVTKKVYECSQKDAAKMVGVHVNTIYNWRKQSISVINGNYLLIFANVQKIKQKKGFYKG